MRFRAFAGMTLTCVLLAHGAAGAAEPVAVMKVPELSAAEEKVILAEGDISDRPYRVLGQVFVRAKKVGVIDRPSIEDKTDILLKAKAAELGADAVINVRRERKGMSFFNLGYMDGFGTAVAFGRHAVAAAPSQPAPAASTQPAAPQVAARPPTPSTSTDPLKAFLEAINGGNADAASSMFDDEAVIEDPAGSRPIVGRGAVESYIAGLTARGARYEMVLPVGNSGMGAAAMALRIHTDSGVENTVHTFAYGPNGMISKLTINRDPTLR